MSNIVDIRQRLRQRRFYIAGLSIRVIAEMLGWSEEQVEKIIRRYVARDAATKAAIRQLNEARRESQ
jgi:transposase